MTFPIITWPEEILSTKRDLRVTANAVTEVVQLSLTGGIDSGATYWGYGPTESIGAALAAALQTHSELATVTHDYEYAPSGIAYPQTMMNGDIAFSILWSDVLTTADPDVFGSDGADTASSDEVGSSWNAAGFWCPGLEGTANAYDDEDITFVVMQTRSEHANAESSYSTVSWGERKDVSVPYDYVDDAYIRAYRAADTVLGFPGRAGRNAADPNNLLENLLRAAAAGKTFRIFTDATTYRTVKLKFSGPFSVKSFTKPVSNSGAKFSVTLPFEEVA